MPKFCLCMPLHLRIKRMDSTCYPFQKQYFYKFSNPCLKRGANGARFVRKRFENGAGLNCCPKRGANGARLRQGRYSRIESPALSGSNRCICAVKHFSHRPNWSRSNHTYAPTSTQKPPEKNSSFPLRSQRERGENSDASLEKSYYF